MKLAIELMHGAADSTNRAVVGTGHSSDISKYTRPVLRSEAAEAPRSGTDQVQRAFLRTRPYGRC